MLSDFGEDSRKSVGLCPELDPVRQRGDSAIGGNHRSHLEGRE